jgi:hypothetical protein
VGRFSAAVRDFSVLQNGQAVESTHPSIQWLPAALSPEVKQPECEGGPLTSLYS